MRVLNRPMFRYGGPIKEGIMTGMKDGGRTLLAGQHPKEFKDVEGREQHFAPLVALGGLGTAALRFLPAAYRGFKAARAYTPMSQNLGAGKRFLDIFTPKGGLKITGGQAGEGAGFRVGSFLRQNPITSLSLAPQVASGIYSVGKSAVEAAPDLAKGYVDMLIPGESIFKTKEDIKTTEDDTGSIKRGVKNKVVPTPSGTDQTGNDQKNQINEDRVNEAKQKYYKLMGIDKMNKEATYDSLIKASKIISEEGGDLKGALKSGTLQSRIIEAIGGELDKSKALKQQINAAVLKGEIEKDINKTKETAFQEQINFIRNNPDDPLAKKLSGATSVADNLAALADKPITSDIVQRLIESKGTAVKGQIKDDKYQKWEKNNENKDEIDYLQDVYKGKKIDAGIYVINKKAVQIDKDGNAFLVDLDSILG